MAAPPPPGRPSLKKEGFVIKNGVITCNGFERVDNAHLEKLFHPERHCNQRTLKKFTDEATKLFSRPFFASQLRFYGIAFPKSATEAQLHSLLDKAVLAKQCINVPAPVTQLHQEMKLTYDQNFEAWKTAVDNWDTVWREKQEEVWAQLETPSERASHDLDRFIEHYFLTDGQPDPAKNPEPLALYGLSDDQVIAEIHGRAAQVPGLETLSAGSGSDRAICIGWGRATLCGLAGEIENTAKERQKQRVQAAWEEAMQCHQLFVEKPEPPVSTQSSSQIPAKPALIMARGSFILQCKTVTDNFPDLPNITRLALDISDSLASNGETLRAAVELGVFQGTAVLSFSQAIMDWFVKYYDRTALEAAGRTFASGINSGAKRKFDGAADGERPSKQRKAEEPPPNRIYLRMRGQKATTDEEICADIQHGYLDFADSAWTKFKGILDIPGVGDDIEVEGFRVADRAAVDPPPWNHYWPC